MIVSHKHKFIFISNGKTGTTSLESALQEYNDGNGFSSANGMFLAKHIPPAFARATLGDKIWDDYFKFVFVRNPWDWFVSNWKYNFKYLNLPNYFISSPKEIFKLKTILERNSRAKNKPYSEDDVYSLYDQLKRFRAFPDRMSYFQTDYVFDRNNRRIVDHVARFENFQEEIDFIVQKLSIKIAVPHLNQTRKTEDYRDYFDEKSRQLVKELWAVDVENFGYEF